MLILIGGANHAFYNDRTGKYPEHKIVERIVMLNNFLFEKDKNNKSIKKLNK